MQPFTQKYAIVAFLEPVAAGYVFPCSAWPLHVTIVSTFAVDWSTENIVAKLADCSGNFKPVTSTVGHDEYFGPERDIHVAILNTNQGLMKLHRSVLNCLEPGGLTLNEPQFANHGFRAHVTIQKHTRVNAGDTVTINSLALIDMFPDQDPYRRKVVTIIKLQD